MSYTEQYLALLSVHATSRTVKTYRFWIVSFLESSRRKERDLTIEDVASFAKAIKLRYKPKSVELGLFVVRRFLRFLQERGVTKISVSDMRIPKGYSEREDPITPEEYVAILSKIPASTAIGVRDNILVRLLYDTGCRVGELQQLNEVKGTETSLTIHTEKTPDARIISWGEDTSVFVNTWKQNKKGKPLIPSTRTIERIVAKYGKEAGITRRIHPHLFRHTKAHLILDNQGTIRDVQDILGHRSPVSSFMYLRWNEEKRLDRNKKFLTPLSIDKTLQGEYSGVYGKAINLQTKTHRGSKSPCFSVVQNWNEYPRRRQSAWKKPYVGSECR